MSSSTTFRWIHLIPVIIVLSIGALFLWLPKRHSASYLTANTGSGVKEGKSYYIFVRSLEIAPKKPSGSPWDRVSDEAPDPCYEIHWRDNRIFASPTQRDQLISQWSPLGVDTINSIREGRIALHSVIKAASIRAVGGESFQLRVLDDDPVSQDEIATLTFAFRDLAEGDNSFDFEQTDLNSVTHLQLAVINAELPLLAQIEQILNP